LGPPPCRIIENKEFIILANGEVHPCNVIEYSHEFSLGNILHKNLSEIVKSKDYKNFLVSKSNYCNYCDLNSNYSINFRR
jgi:radical SAM protein with 4Fe4S-binding SPASM domain